MIEKIDRKIEYLMSSDEYDGLGELVKLGKKATPTLINILSKHRDLIMRKRAAVALARIQDKTAIQPLLNALDDNKDPTVIISVIDALASIGVKKAAPQIIPLLKNKDTSVRLHAIKALGILKNKNSIPYLEKLLVKDKHEFIRKEASESLRKIGAL
jgi:HEAT repeat protein